MTRKDYILIAEALRTTWKEEVNQEDVTEERVFFDTAENIVSALQKDNPRFNREHFLAVVRGEKDLNSRPARTKSKANAGLVALANHPGWRQ